MLLMIDNYDSFTYNLVQYFQQLNQNILVVSNDAITVKDIIRLNPSSIVLSPGPNNPDQAGITLEVVHDLHTLYPILGICLGHQSLAQAFGATIVRAPDIIHGKTSWITHHQRGLFTEIPTPFKATRYHSLVIDTPTLPTCFRIDAWANQTIMAISHRQYPLFGLQFHPEAILTEHGLDLLRNFILRKNDDY